MMQKHRSQIIVIILSIITFIGISGGWVSNSLQTSYGRLNNLNPSEELISSQNINRLGIITSFQNQHIGSLVQYKNLLIHMKRYVGDDTRIYPGISSNFLSAQPESFLKTIWEMSLGENGLVLALYDRQKISIWDIAKDKEPTILMEAKNQGLISALDTQGTKFAFEIRPPGDDVALNRGDAQYLYIWNLETQKMLKLKHGHKEAIGTLVFSSNGKILISTDGWTAKVWDAETGTQLEDMEFNGCCYYVISLNPQATILAARAAYIIELWNISNNSQYPLTVKHNYRIGPFKINMAFSPDGKFLASGGVDGIRLWDVTTGEETAYFQPNAPIPIWGNTVWDVAFSPDGKLLASGAGADGTIRIWDLETNTEIRVLHNASTQVWDVTFSEDGKLLVSQTLDSVVQIWGILSN